MPDKIYNYINLYRELLAGGLPVIGASVDGEAEYDRELTDEEKTLEKAIKLAHDPNLPRWEDLDSELREMSKTDLKQLPNWATWTPQEGKDFITNAIFAGQTKEQLDVWIEANVTTLATAKVALKNEAEAIIQLRTYMAVAAQAILYLRNIAAGKLF